MSSFFERLEQENVKMRAVLTRVVEATQGDHVHMDAELKADIDGLLAKSTDIEFEPIIIQPRVCK